MQIDKNENYYKEGCPDCGNSKKIDNLYNKFETTNTILLQKIEILNISLGELLRVIGDQRVQLATLNQTTNSNSSFLKILNSKNNEDHRQIHSKISREIVVLENKINKNIETVKKDLREDINKFEMRQYEGNKELNKMIGRKMSMTLVGAFIIPILIFLFNFLFNS